MYGQKERSHILDTVEPILGHVRDITVTLADHTERLDRIEAATSDSHLRQGILEAIDRCRRIPPELPVTYEVAQDLITYLLQVLDGKLE